MADLRILEYLDPQARSFFAAWFEGINAVAAAKATAAIYQLTVGNWSNVKGVGAGVFERKIDAGPGHRDGEKALGRLSLSQEQQEDVTQSGETYYGTHTRIQEYDSGTRTTRPTISRGAFHGGA